MSNPTIELSKDQIINALVQFTHEELKGLMGELFMKKAFIPPTLREIEEETSQIVKQENHSIDILKEAKRWGRSKK